MAPSHPASDGGLLSQPWSCNLLRLLVPEMPINGAFRQEPVMMIDVDDPATVDHQYLISIGKHRQAMRDDNDGPSRGHAPQIAANNHLTLGIERARRFV